MIDEDLNTKSYIKNMLSECISQNKFFENKLLLFLGQIQFGKQEGFDDISISNINYYHSKLHNNKLFYFSHN